LWKQESFVVLRSLRNEFFRILLDSYLQEFCWRFNRRHAQPSMFDTLLGELAAKPPMTYKKLTREVF
jgi:hypothetical protein